MSTTRPYPAGDCGPEPEGAWTAAGAPEAGHTAPGGGAGPGATGRGPTGAVGDATEPSKAPQPATPPGSAGPAGSSGPAAQGEGEGTSEQPLRQVRRLRLVGAGGAVARARDFTRQALQDWGWLPAATADQQAAAEDVLLVVSELVTNACLHASGPEELRIGSSRKLLRLEVVDLGSGSPAPRTPHRAGRPGGHGMFIVQRLCLDWGVVRSPEGTGKTVWAELAAPS